MKKWSNKKLESYAKREKFRKSRSRSSDSSNPTLEKEFELPKKDWEPLLAQGYFSARVMEVHKRYAFVSTEKSPLDIDTSDVWLASIARKYTQTFRKERNFVSVGDIVLCRAARKDEPHLSDDLPSCIIEHRCPRASKIARLDPMVTEREHVLAANVTQLVIVASYVYPKVKWGLIDRYLVLAEEEGIKAAIILNKKDLLKEQKKEFIEICKEYQKLYTGLNYEIIDIQANKCKKSDIKKIAAMFQDHVSILSGHSGVGKSTIINLLKPEIYQDVDTEGIITKGRHTTTYASMIKLAAGGFVIDTPGIRSFLLETRDPISLAHGFVEMRPLISKCKYRECRHIEEPECAVLNAVNNGVISKLRYKSYLAILTGASGREGRLGTT